MRRKIILGLLLFVLAVTSGCGGSGAAVRPGALDTELGALFRQGGAALISALKRQLRASDDGREALDVQTAITLEMARMPARRVADRGQFQRAAAHLDRMIAAADGRAPADSAVLAYLANLANGRSASASYLSDAEEEAVLKLCGPAHEVMAYADTEGESTADRLLRQSCFTWLVGDAEKSNALFYLAVSSDNAVAGQRAENGFEAFLRRYQHSTGRSLLAHRARLKVGDKQAGLLSARGGTGTRAWLSTSVH